MRTTYGSAIFRDHVPARTATAVQRIVDAGAVIVGKANLHEFAWGVTSKNPFYGTVGNPRRPGHIAGGSSGGSAAALSAGLAALSIGTDTGGSIRIPSFACGTSGFKPSHGLVPIDGCYPLAPVLRPRRADGADDGGVRARARGARRTCPVPSRASPACASASSARSRTWSRLEASGAHCEEAALPPWEHALPIFAAECAYTHRELYPERRDEYSPDLQRKMDAGFELPAVTYRALWDEVDGVARALRARAALRRPRRPHAAVRASARRGGGDAGVPRARHGRRCGRSTGSAGRPRRRATACCSRAGATRRCSRPRSRGRRSCRPRRPTDTAAGSSPPSR